MKRMTWVVLALGLFRAAATAQTPSPTPGNTYNPASQGCCVAGTQLMTGTVWDYRPGQSITVKIEEGKQFEMALDPGVRVDGSVSVGRLASVMWTTDSSGKTHVMSITAAPGSAMDVEHSVPSMVTPTPRPTPASTSTPVPSSATPRRAARSGRPTPTPAP